MSGCGCGGGCGTCSASAEKKHILPGLPLRKGHRRPRQAPPADTGLKQRPRQPQLWKREPHIRGRGSPVIQDVNRSVECGTNAAPDPILRAGGGIPKTSANAATQASLLLAGFGAPLEADDAVATLYEASRQFMRQPPTLLAAGNGPNILRANPGQQIQTAGPLIAAELRFRYRTESFTVNPGWLTAYMMEIYSLSSRKSEGGGPMVSSVEDSLDALWPEFRAAARGDMVNFHNLIGCYNLHRSEGWPDHPYLFWSGGWGAPYQVHLYMCQLALTYSYFAELTEEDYGPLAMGEDNPCRALGPFTEIMLDGYAVDIEGDSSGECWLSISYRNTDSRYETQLHQRCDVEDPSCNQPYQENCVGVHWDNWEPEWDREYMYWGADGRVPPNEIFTFCDTNANAKDFQITIPPLRLAFEGFTCDQILFLARMCRDYGQYLRGNINLDRAIIYTLNAQKLARYALRVIASRSSNLIHEVGHILTGKNSHCKTNCCMDAAAEKWECKVRALLGLPIGKLYYLGPPRFGDYTNPNSVDFPACAWCSSDSGVQQYMAQFCNTIHEGKPGQAAAFVASGCRTSECS